MNRIPTWLKLLFTAWVLIWAPLYWWQYGPQNYFWFCNLANFLILAGLWKESRLILSSQLLAVLIVGIVWTLDVSVAFLTGNPPVADTDYMFDEDRDLWVRLLSLFHVALPLVTGYAVYRVGYDSNGLILQTAITWIMIPASRLFTDPERSINWAHPPFPVLQEAFPPLLYVILLMVIMPLVVYLPAHGAIVLLKRWRDG